MISKILKEMENTAKPVSLRFLCRKLELEESALEGMMQLLVQKGVVRDSSRCMDELQKNHSIPQCGGCTVSNCPIAQNLPKTYSLVNKKSSGIGE
ncbi:MAG: hypothetical protein JW908_06420 [Anaerolineales bacterium]|nr:hypothetical protein [Anaerolineales bacterium]